MFLKRMQAVGFKSFADKISIPFDTGITGIVGPNGSGKSNVIDAVRWVMGEQNAKNLRGKVATDIIFSGAANRKPMAMAEVTLVFDNSDESAFCPPEYRHELEISLTRRLYMDGQREYLINRKPCRLKDILNFFTTTGLGGRSYSMIQQGQVDRILNAKPEDVRIIIEEAAGTLVYKNRREEALKKLLQTKENLSRIEDIVVELERQQSNLKTQMEKAKNWRELSGNLQRQELKLFTHNFHFYNDQLRDLQGSADEQINSEIELLAKISALEAQQTNIQNTLDASDPGLEGLRESVSSIREQIARAESIIGGTDSKVDQHKKRLEDLDREIVDDTEALSAFEAQMKEAELELTSAQEKAGALRESIESFQEQVDAVDEEALVFRQKLEDFEDELKNIERLLENNTLRCEAINREREKISTDSDATSERLQILDQELVESKKRLVSAEEKANLVQSGLDEEVRLKSSFEEAIRFRQQELEQLAENRDLLKDQYFSSRARLTSLQELIAQSSDVSSVIGLLKEHSEAPQALQFGMLTDYLSFNEEAEGLSKHLKSMFEKWAERLIVENFKDLEQLTRACHKHSTGGLPVSVLSPSELAHEEIKVWAEHTDAEPLVQYLKINSNSPKLESILSRLYVLQGLSLGEDDIKKLPAGLIAFTSQGLCIGSQSEFLIGVSDGTQGMLTRKSEVEKLTEDLKQAEIELAHCQSRIDQLNVAQEEEKNKLRALDQKLQTQNKEALEVLSELQSVKQTYTHKQDLRQSASAQKLQLEQYDRKLCEELEEQGQARLSLDDEQQRVKSEMEILSDDSQGIEDRREEVFRQHEARKLDLAKIETREQSLSQSFEQLRSHLNRLQSVLSRRYEEKSRIEVQISEIRTQYDQSIREMEVLLSKRENLEVELSSKREENHGLLEELRRVDAELKKLRDEYNKVEKSLSQKKVDMERLRLAVEGISQQAMEKYHLDISTQQFEVDLEFDEKKLTREVQKLRSKIEDLGAINMMAIEEYDTLMTRLEFIIAQREEVFNSINLLEDALEEIEETTKEKFLETFATVDAEFQNLFPILFPGGEGRLDMSTPEDPLNSGVEILARLPGKKAQRMTLLSGGEKALTAISLIFALLKTKPTPFCFLDEVDAPLDESNVGRYNRVLEALSDRFQFIVITHNRRTMEVLDTLFGVTMQEPGVSKVVGVDMKKDIPDHLKKAFKERENEDSRVGASAQ